MKTTVEFLDALRAMHGLKSDYQLSQFLGCTRGAISSYRTGRTYLDEEMAMKVAFELNLDDGYVMACVASERARKPEVKKAWAHAAELLYGLAAALALVAILPIIPATDEHSFNVALLGFTGANFGRTLYIMSNLLAAYWWLLIPLAALALLAFPRYRRR